jgi:hypothetical protein
MTPMSALSQAGLLSECLERKKGQFKLAAFGAILWFVVGITVPVYAQQSTPYVGDLLKPTPNEAPRLLAPRVLDGQSPQGFSHQTPNQAPREMLQTLDQDPQQANSYVPHPTPSLRLRGTSPPPADSRISTLDLALNALMKQKELIAALESRVDELEKELADCKAQTQEVVPPKQ